MKTAVSKIILALVASMLVWLSLLIPKEAVGNLFGPYVGSYYPGYYQGYGYGYRYHHRPIYFHPHYYIDEPYLKGHYIQNGRLYHIRELYSGGGNTNTNHFHYETGRHYH